jgi:hypothetical protein
MKSALLPVKVSPGMFTSERVVSFEGIGKHYTLIVDEMDVEKGFLKVYVVAEGDREVIIDLPRETFTSGNRVRVPSVNLRR